MSANILYTDLSAYYDLLCADIDYYVQSASVKRLNQLFGNGGKLHLDLACGTGPHVRHFLDFGFTCSGLDLNQPMLALALQLRIEKSSSLHHEEWRDEHPMVAFDFKELERLLAPYFHVHTFEHDYQKIIPLSEDSGNGIFVCVKR